MTYYGDFPTSHTAVCMVFDTFAASTGAPTATTNFANTDIQIYKDGGTTQRSSANGIVVSTSFDGSTGLQMVTIDLSDNTDAGFYAAGHEYQVAVADITADGQTLRFWLGCFSIERANGVLALLKGNAVKVDVNTIKTQTVTCSGGVTIPAATLASTTNITAATGVDITKILGTAISTPATAGILDVNVKNIDNDAASASGTVTFPNATLASTTNITAGTITTVTNLTNAPTSGDFTATMKTSIGTAVAASAVASVTGNVGGNVAGSVGSVTGLTASNLDTTVSSRLAAATTLTEGYAADGVAPTLQQILFMILQNLAEFAISGTTLTVKQLDGSTTAMTFTLDSSTAPTSRTRAT